MTASASAAAMVALQSSLQGQTTTEELRRLLERLVPVKLCTVSVIQAMANIAYHRSRGLEEAFFIGRLCVIYNITVIHNHMNSIKNVII